MSVLECSVHGNDLHLDNYPLLTSGSKGVDMITISFDEDWFSEDFIYKVSFYRDKNSKVIRTLYEDGFFYTNLIPDSMLATPGILYFSVFAVHGSTGDIVKSSNTISHVITEGLLTGEAPPTWPTEAIAFKDLIIDTLNAKFNLNLNYSSSDNDISSAIESVDVTPLSEDSINTFVRIYSEVYNETFAKYNGVRYDNYPIDKLGYDTIYPKLTNWIFDLWSEVQFEDGEPCDWTEDQLKHQLKYNMQIESEAIANYMTLQMILSHIIFHDAETYSLVLNEDPTFRYESLSLDPDPRKNLKQATLILKSVFEQLREYHPYVPPGQEDPNESDGGGTIENEPNDSERLDVGE